MVKELARVSHGMRDAALPSQGRACSRAGPAPDLMGGGGRKERTGRDVLHLAIPFDSLRRALRPWRET